MPGRDQFTEPVTRDVTITVDGNDIDVLQPLENVQVTVYRLNEDGTRQAAPATLFATRGPDNAPFGPGNPFVTDASGKTGFFAPPGEYEIVYHDLNVVPRIGDQSTWWSSMPGKDDGLSLSVLPEYGRALCPAGTVLPFAGGVEPTGWVFADGRVVDRVGAYAALFAAIGTAYNLGGEAGTQFRLPDLRGRDFRGADNFGSAAGAAGRLNSVLAADRARGKVGGVDVVTLDTTQIPAHGHGVTDPQHGHSISDPGHTHGTIGGRNTSGGFGLTNLSTENFTPNTTTMSSGTGIGINANYTGISINSAGGGQPHNNLPPYQLGSWIVKL